MFNFIKYKILTTSFSKEEKSFTNFLILWSGEFISSIGSGLSSFGLSIYIYQQTGKVSLMTIATLLAFLPSLLLSVPAGVLADRYDRRLLMILGDSLSAGGLLFILFFLLQGKIEIWQIYIGVTISSIFSSLLEPAYKATITDLLNVDQYAKASGLVQIAGSAKYLISPILAGALLTIGNVSLLLLIDVCTFFVTLFTTLAVRKGLKKQHQEIKKSFFIDIKEGWQALKYKKGVLSLVIMGSAITFCVGVIQTLSSPLILSFSTSSMLGTLTSVIALGMLVSSLIIGVKNIKQSYVKCLCISLFGAGVFMALFGVSENIILIGIAGFLFFSMLPFANTCIDVLLRTNIENKIQGRAWGLIGLISQSGYVGAYLLSGVLADYLFIPLLNKGGALSNNLGRLIGIGPGRGIGLLIIIAGILLSLLAVFLYRMKSIQTLENGKAYEF